MFKPGDIALYAHPPTLCKIIDPKYTETITSVRFLNRNYNNHKGYHHDLVWTKHLVLAPQQINTNKIKSWLND